VRRSAARLGVAAKGLTILQKRVKSTVSRYLLVEARRDMRLETTVPAARVSADMRVRLTEYGVDLIGVGRGIGLVNFDGKWGGRLTPGATAQVIKSGPVQLEIGSFIAELPGGARQIVSRYGPKVRASKGNYAGQMRQKLLVEYGPSVAKLLSNSKRRRRLIDFANEIAIKEADRLLLLIT